MHSTYSIHAYQQVVSGMQHGSCSPHGHRTYTLAHRWTPPPPKSVLCSMPEKGAQLQTQLLFSLQIACYLRFQPTPHENSHVHTDYRIDSRPPDWRNRRVSSPNVLSCLKMWIFFKEVAQSCPLSSVLPVTMLSGSFLNPLTRLYVPSLCIVLC